MPSDLNASSIEFLLTDLDTALTFMDLAEVTRHEENAERHYTNAWNAYNTVLRLMQRVTMTPAQTELINAKLALLRTRLQDVGKL